MVFFEDLSVRFCRMTNWPVCDFFTCHAGSNGWRSTHGFSSAWVWLGVIHALQNFSAHYHEEKCCGETTHQNAGQSFNRSEQSPFFWEHYVPVADRGIGDARKIERRLHVREAFLPPEKQGPDGDLKHMNNNKQPSDANQQPSYWPEAPIGSLRRMQHVTQYQPEAGGVNYYGDRNKCRGNRKVGEHRSISRSLLDRSFLKIFDCVRNAFEAVDAAQFGIHPFVTEPITHG